MRKFIYFWGVATCSFLAATETVSLELKNDQLSQIKTSFIPYLQLAYGVVPGAGCSIRVQKAYLGLQFDANAATVVTAGVREVTMAGAFINPLGK